MPNQRKKGKRKIGLWVEDAQGERLRELADAKGLSVSDLIKEAIRLYHMSAQADGKNKHSQMSGQETSDRLVFDIGAREDIMPPHERLKDVIFNGVSRSVPEAKRPRKCTVSRMVAS